MTCLSAPLMLSLPKSALLVNMLAMEQSLCVKITLKQQHCVACVISTPYTSSPPPPTFYLNVFVFGMKCAVMVVCPAHITM